MQIEHLLAQLSRVTKTGRKKWVARCPSHEDPYADLCIRESPDGFIVMHCGSGCATHEILRAIHAELWDLALGGIPPRAEEPKDTLMLELKLEAKRLQQVFNEEVNSREDLQRIILSLKRITNVVEEMAISKKASARYSNGGMGWFDQGEGWGP